MRHAQRCDAEELRHLAQGAAGQQFEAGLGAVIGIAGKFTLLDRVQQHRQTRIVRRHGNTGFGQTYHEVGAPGLI